MLSKILDPRWRFEHLLYIRGTDGIRKFKMRPNQERAFNLIQPCVDNKINSQFIWLKGRQNGTSSFCGAFCLNNSAYKSGFVADTLADTQERSSAIFQNVVKFAWDRIPPELRPQLDRDNVQQLDFGKLGSKYIISATKSEPVDLLHISEAPYFLHEERITEALQMVRPTGTVIMESTAFGVGNLFEQIFSKAWEAHLAGKPYHWQPIFDPWFTDPTNRVAVLEGAELKHPDLILPMVEKYGLSLEQQFFYDQKYDDLDEEVFQFYPSEPREAFLSSGRPVFNLRMVQDLQDKHARTGSTEEDWTFFQEIDGDISIGVDPAEGLATGDNSAAKALNRKGEEVATLAGKYDPEQLAEKVAWLCRRAKSRGFENYTVVERNNHGHAVINELKNFREVRLYRSEDTDAVTQKKVMKYGWNTNHKTKAVAITELRKAIKRGEVTLYDFETYQELLFYMYGDRGTMNATTGKHADRIIATALANMGLIQWLDATSLDLNDYGIY